MNRRQVNKSVFDLFSLSESHLIVNSSLSMMACLFVRDSNLIVASSYVHVVPMKDDFLPLSAGAIISSGPFGAADPVAAPDSFGASDCFGRADPLAASCPSAAAVPCAGSLSGENGTTTVL